MGQNSNAARPDIAGPDFVALMETLTDYFTVAMYAARGSDGQK